MKLRTRSGAALPKLFGAALLLVFLPSVLPAQEESSESGFEIVGKSGGKAPAAAQAESGAGDGDATEFEIVGKEAAAKGRSSAGEAEIVDDPNFEIVRRRSGAEQRAADEKKETDDYERRYQEYLRAKSEVREFLFFTYKPAENTVNGLDARVFLTLFLISLISVAAMLVLLVRELGRRPPVYSVEQMVRLRSGGFAPTSAQNAKAFVMNLWFNMTGGRELTEDEPVPVASRGELNILSEEIAIAAGALPTDPEAVGLLNRLADSVCWWKKRRLIAPGISVDSGVVKRVVMAIVYCILLYLYRAHPMYLLVVFSPLAFLTPTYLVSAREGSLVYRALGGSLKLFGTMTGSALEGAGNMEGATATVYRTGFGTAYVEKNYWGVLIVFLLKIAFALLFLYLVFVLAPVIVLYAVVRNYILAK